jgi:hypothetical protein
MITRSRLRRAATLAVATVALALGGMTAAAAPASAATAGAAPTGSLTITLHSSGKANGIHPAITVDLCTVSATVHRYSNGNLGTEGFVSCGDPDFAVSDDWGFYNYGRLYAYAPDFGTSYNGLYIVAELQGGGTVGHRTVEWCLTITDNEGRTGGACLFPAVNI